MNPEYHVIPRVDPEVLLIRNLPMVPAFRADLLPSGRTLRRQNAGSIQLYYQKNPKKSKKNYCCSFAYFFQTCSR